MRRKLSSWLELFGSLGQALGRLLQAEVVALSGDLKLAGRGVVKALALFTFALFVAFWALGALTYVLVEVLALWLPRWGAATLVLGLLVLLALILALVGRAVLSRLEKPADTVRRHLDDHRAWWGEHVAELGSGEPSTADAPSRAGRKKDEEAVS